MHAGEKCRAICYSLAGSQDSASRVTLPLWFSREERKGSVLRPSKQSRAIHHNLREESGSEATSLESLPCKAKAICSSRDVTWFEWLPSLLIRKGRQQEGPKRGRGTIQAKCSTFNSSIQIKENSNQSFAVQFHWLLWEMLFWPSQMAAQKCTAKEARVAPRTASGIGA